MSDFTRDENDLTTGNLLVKMIKYTIPILLTSVISMLFTMTDLITVSKCGGGANSMGAIGTNTPAINLIVGLFLGLGTGANIVAANAKGCGDKARAFKTTQSSIFLAVVSGFIIGFFGQFIAEPLLKFINCDPALLEDAVAYLKIYLLGAPVMLVFNFGSAILRAYGDSKRPLYALLFSGVFNIGLNLLFVVVFKMDVIGVAIATDISQIFGAAAVLYFLKTDKRLFVNYMFSKFKLYKEETIEVLKLGLSAGIQSVVFNITNVLIQGCVNVFGAAATAGNSASSTIEGYQYYVLNSISVAVMAFIAQNNGARKKENIKKVMKYAMLLQIIVPTIVGIIIFLFRKPLVGLFIDKNEPEFDQILEAAFSRIIIISLTYFICGINDTLSSYFRGLKYSLFPTVVTFIGVIGLRLLFIFALFYNVDYFHNLYWLFATYPISWIICIIIYLAFYKSKTKKVFDTYSTPLEYAVDTRINKPYR